ncbi:VWA domain-containing protein [Pyxidicoccus sp. 3LG]
MKKVIQRVAVGLACAVGLTSGVASADEHVVILLDRTGSMGAASTSTPGFTRFQVAKERINTFLDSVPSDERVYAFWTFDGTAPTQVFSFAQGKTALEVKAAVNAATLGGVTPLARTVCDALDTLIDYLPNEPQHTKRIIMATDGAENATPSNHQCWGPSSTTVYPTLQQNSWQWKVRNMACTGNPLIDPGAFCDPSQGLSVIVDIDHLYDYVQLQPGLGAVDDEGVPVAGDAAALAALPVTPDAAFFGGLSSETGGYYFGITSSTPRAQAIPVPGDATGDGCVNAADNSAVLALFGQQVRPGTRADFNRDLIVNAYDRNTVLQNLGRGCTATR